MKKLIIAASLAAICTIGYAADEQTTDNAAANETPAPLASRTEKFSYGLGHTWASQLKQSGVDLNADLLIQGIRDSLAGKPSRVSEEELRQVMMAVQTELMQKQMKDMQALAEKNQKEGEAFLDQNKDKEGVITTESGLQYKVLTEGTGASPDKNDRVTVNYVGKLVNGTVFDSSIAHNKPAVFAVNQVIPGWTEALVLMKEGGKYEVYIPSDLAYGEMGAGPQIGPNAVLIFEVELLKVEKVEGTGEEPEATVQPQQ